MNPKVSVLIRVRNEAEFLRQCLAALKEQDYENFEIIVVDNASEDGSRTVAREAKASILSISKDAFSYGRALNLGMQEAKGDYVILLSAHSLVVGRNFISEAVKPFANPQVAAVRCMHVLNQEDVKNWTGPGLFGWPIAFEEVMHRGPVACGCAIRRSVWQEIPFDETLASVEDKFWAIEALKRKYLVCQAPALYLYLKDRTLLEAVRIHTRDRLVFYEQTGKYFPNPPRLLELLDHLFLDLPLRTARQAIKAILIYLNLKTFPWRKNRRAPVAPAFNQSGKTLKSSCEP